MEITPREFLDALVKIPDNDPRLKAYERMMNPVRKPHRKPKPLKLYTYRVTSPILTHVETIGIVAGDKQEAIFKLRKILAPIGTYSYKLLSVKPFPDRSFARIQILSDE